MKQKILRIALVATVLAAGIFAQASAEIRIAVEGAYPPFSMVTSDGSVQGFDIDITKALCKKMKEKCELVIQDWDGMIPGLLARKYDAIIASMSITEDRKKKVNFSDKYYSTTASFVAKKNSGLTLTKNVANNKRKLTGKNIGVQQGTVSDKYISDNYQDVADIKRYIKQEEVYLDLTSGRLDVIFADTIPLEDGFLSKSNGSDYEFISPGFDDKQWFGDGIGIAIRKKDTKLLKRFNKAIVSIRRDGSYDRIQKNYFKFDIFGN